MTDRDVYCPNCNELVDILSVERSRDFLTGNPSADIACEILAVECRSDKCRGAKMILQMDMQGRWRATF